MRRLNPTRGDDKGVATIFVILAMTAILIGAAFAIDVGGYVSTARSAQSSADGTALAVATDCALGVAPGNYEIYRKDGQTINSPSCGGALEDCSNHATITVTDDVDGLLLAQSAGSVDRSATACWGTLAQASTVPLVIAMCEFDKFPIENRTDITIHLPDTKKSTGCASGPGGFGQLDEDAPCVSLITALLTSSGKPGNDLFKVIPCITNPAGPALPHDLLIPIYDHTKCPDQFCQGNGDYPIVGFASFHITGYSFQSGGPSSSAGTLRSPAKCDNTVGKNCIRGNFEEIIEIKGRPGPSGDFGVSLVYLYK